MKIAATLIELMISIAIFAFISGAIFIVFAQGQRSYFNTSKKILLQVDARKSLDIITHKIYNSNINTYSYIKRVNANNKRRDILSFVEYNGYATISSSLYKNYYTIIYATLTDNNKTSKLGNLILGEYLPSSPNLPKPLNLSSYTSSDIPVNNKRILTSYLDYAKFSLDYIKQKIQVNIRLKTKELKGSKYIDSFFEINSTLTPKNFTIN